jgi:hypothetical protein
LGDLVGVLRLPGVQERRGILVQVRDRDLGRHLVIYSVPEESFTARDSMDICIASAPGLGVGTCRFSSSPSVQIEHFGIDTEFRRQLEALPPEELPDSSVEELLPFLGWPPRLVRVQSPRWFDGGVAYSGVIDPVNGLPVATRVQICPVAWSNSQP